MYNTKFITNKAIKEYIKEFKFKYPWALEGCGNLKEEDIDMELEKLIWNIYLNLLNSLMNLNKKNIFLYKD